MKESEELKSARAKYLAKLTRYGGLPMPATAHYTQGYKDGSEMLWAVAQTCAEAERRLEEMTRQRDLAVEALENCRLLAARHRKEEWAGHIMRFCKDAGLSGSPIRNDSIKESENNKAS